MIYILVYAIYIRLFLKERVRVCAVIYSLVQAVYIQLSPEESV